VSHLSIAVAWGDITKHLQSRPPIAPTDRIYYHPKRSMIY
jgi:hypothetical protein